MTSLPQVQKGLSKSVFFLVLVAALGYFVDVYDLLLFSIVRVSSLQSLGFSGDAILQNGVYLINVQMIGMLLGGICWGMLGDKRGRLSVLFGSICVYSIANITNAFVTSLDGYAISRFVAGFGLAGELGAGITLVGESLPKQYRGYGTTIVASVGVSGAVVAALVGDSFDWRISYVIGGMLGLILLLLRFGVFESGLYDQISQRSDLKRGSLGQLFGSWDRIKRFLCAVFSGSVVWFVVGILITFAPEFGKAFGMLFTPKAGDAVMWCYAGLVVGDLVSGLLSQIFQSRKRILLWFQCLTALGIALYLKQETPSLFEFYLMCSALGFAVGFWAVFVTTASEQFGTNLRSTVTTMVPNFVRASLVPLTWLFQYLKAPLGIISSAGFVAAFVLTLGLISILGLKESSGQDLNFVEE